MEQSFQNDKDTSILLMTHDNGMMAMEKMKVGSDPDKNLVT